MQKNYNTLLLWSHDSSLVVNTKKTKVLHIRSSQYPTRSLNIITHSSQCLHTNTSFYLPCECHEMIDTKSEFRYLGVWLDTRFKFDIHIQYLNNQLRTCSNLIFQLRSYRQTSTLKIIYCAFIEQLIRYRIQSWGNTTPTYLQSIARQQNRILKSMCSRRLSTGEDNLIYFRHLNVLLVGQLMKYITVLKFIHIKNFKEIQNHGYETRGADRFVEPRYNNQYGCQLLEYVVPSLFNQLPSAVTQATSYRGIKKELRKWLLEPG